MIIIMLLLQYFYNKGYVACCNWFLFSPTIDITFLPTFNNLPPRFCCEIFWKCFVSNTTCKIFNFIKKKKKSFNLLHLSWKKKINLLSRTLAYFAIDSGMELFFPALFFFINKKLHHHYNQQIYIYIWDSFLILSSMCP